MLRRERKTGLFLLSVFLLDGSVRRRLSWGLEWGLGGRSLWDVLAIWLRDDIACYNSVSREIWCLSTQG